MTKPSQALPVIHTILSHIDKVMWDQVATNKVHKMTPVNVKLMNQYTFQSLAQLNSTYLQQSDSLKPKEQCPKIPKENFVESSIPVHSKAGPTIMPNSSSMRSTLKKLSNNPSIIFKNSRVSSQGGQFPRTRTNGSLGLNPKFISIDLKTTDTQKHQKDKYFTKNIDSMRDKILFIEQKRKQEQQINQLARHEKIERETKLRKKMKQIQRLSYDYTGQLLNSKNPNTEGTLGGAAMIRSSINYQKYPTMMENKKVLNSLRMRTISTLIQNQRVKEREQKIRGQKMLTQSMEPLFKQNNAVRLSSSFKDQECLSQGCWIEQKTTSFSKHKLLNRSGQNKTLDQYKRDMAGRKYKQFRLKTHKKLKNNKIRLDANSEDETNKLNDQEDNEYRERNRRLKTMISSEKSQILSGTLLSHQIGKTRERGSICVSNPSLFESVFSQNCEEY